MMLLLVDTLLQDKCLCDSLLCQVVQPEQASWFTTISFGDTLTILCTLIGLGIAILQYRHSSRESRVQSQRNQRETWFLQVIVLPQLENINNFYINLLKSLDEDKMAIQKYGKEQCHQDYLNKMAEIQDSRKTEINNFFDHISALVKSYDKCLGGKVEEVVMELEDIYVRILEIYGNEGEAKEREEVLGNKEKLVAILNSGMNDSNDKGQKTNKRE